MKREFIILAALFLSVFIFYACSDDSVTDPDPTDTTNYFPNASGNYYKYSVDKRDSAGVQTTGTRSSTYNGTTTLAGVSYQIQTDTLAFTGQSTSTNSFFRESDTGIFYYLDTTGLSDVVDDSLIQYIQLDAELRAFTFPLTDGKLWTVFKMNLSYSFININLVDVTAYYLGKEDITLNLNTGQEIKEAAKIQFVLTLKVPNPNNPLSTSQQTFETFAWLAADIGVVKWEGNGTLLNVFAGGGINFDDSTTVVSQNLIEYSVN